MPRAPTSSQMSARPSPLQRFCCPHCQRLFKRKSGWTQHIQSMHSELGITYAQSQSAVISVPILDYTQVLPPTADHQVPIFDYTQVLPPTADHQVLSSPPTSPLQLSENHHNIYVDLPSKPLSDLLSSPPSESDVTTPFPKEYHPIINGRMVY